LKSKYKIGYDHKSVQCAFCSRQIVMQKDSIEALHQINIIIIIYYYYYY